MGRRKNFALFIIVILAGCTRTYQSSPDTFLPDTYAPSPTPFQPIRWTPTFAPPTPTLPPTATPSPTLSPYSIAIADTIPQSFIATLTLPPEWGLTDQSAAAGLQLSISDENPVSHWVYALAASFPTVVDDVSAGELHAAWKGATDSLWGGAPLMMAEPTLRAIAAYWGEPAPGAVQIIPAGELADQAWAARPSWAIIPFEELNPRWKVLAIDGISPLHKDFNLTSYELTIPISLRGGTPPEGLVIPESNRDPNKLTVVAMTGVTALVRATAFAMEQQGISYPGLDVAAWLREADITHISNEVPFAEDCPYPNPVQEGMRFCSRDKYIGLLEDVGTDVVELTGDHFSDWGGQAMLHTLELYAERGWAVYGGGANLQEGRRGALIEHNGNRLAFIGCNAKGGGYAQASASNPGAVACDFDWLTAEIARLRAEGYLTIATFQHFEYYTYTAQPNQIADARRLTEAGAVIVSGSQAHHPQAFEFSHGGFVHHGLGNLFFDQFAVSYATRQGFIDRHIFYNGQHISTELLTILFIDYARPRPMTAEERTELLNAAFQASGW